MELIKLSIQYKILVVISILFVAKLLSSAILRMHAFTTEKLNSYSAMYVPLPDTGEKNKESSRSILLALPWSYFYIVITGRFQNNSRGHFILGAYLELLFCFITLNSLSAHGVSCGNIVDTLIILFFISTVVLFLLRVFLFIRSHEDIWVVDAEDYLLPNNNPDVNKQIKTLRTINKIKRFFFVK